MGSVERGPTRVDPICAYVGPDGGIVSGLDFRSNNTFHDAGWLSGGMERGVCDEGDEKN